MTSTCLNIIEKTIQEQYAKQQADNVWSGKKYEKINELKNDYSGKVGELIAKKFCQKFKIPHNYEEDRIDDEATYDIVIKGKKVEVKTGRLGKHGGFQHESLRDGGCDYFMFIDVLPSKLYLTVFSSNFNFSKRHPIIGRKPHLRKGTTNVYKFDFGNSTFRKAIASGICIEIDSNTKDSDIKKFLNKVIK